MTAPVEPPQASSDGAVAESNDLVIGGNRIPLPRWARFLVGILAILVAAVPLLNIFGVPVTQLASVISKPTPSPTVTSTPTPAPVSDSGHKLSDAQMFNYRESDRHANETARTDKIIFDSRDLGTLRVKFFISDRCLQVIRKSAGDNPLTISQYIPATKMEDQAPGPLGAQAWLPQDTTVDRDLLDSQLEPASFAPEGEAQPHQQVTVGIHMAASFVGGMDNRTVAGFRSGGRGPMAVSIISGSIHAMDTGTATKTALRVFTGATVIIKHQLGCA